MRFVVLLLVSALVPTIASAEDSAGARDRAMVDQSYLCLRTLGELRSARTALQAYLVDNGSLPAGTSSIEDVRALVEPVYIRTLVTVDRWGTPFRIRVTDDGRSFLLVSAGSDRRFDEATWGASGLQSDSADDAVLRSTGDGDREWVIQR